MSTAAMTKRISDVSPRVKARLAGLFYLLSIVMGAFTELVVPGRAGMAARLVTALGYFATTVLIYDLFKSREQYLLHGGEPT